MKTSILSHIIALLFATNIFAAEIIFDSDAKIKTSGAQNFIDQKAGTTLDLKSGSEVLVVTPKNIPLLIFTPQSSDSKVTISEGMMEQALMQQVQPLVQQSTNDILRELKKVELLIQKRELNQALTITTTLKQKYKNISSILFMSGTVFYLLNNKVNAIEDLEAGLKIDPTDDSAKKLLERLKGAS